jgi:lysophospholipase L1-like esterase
MEILSQLKRFSRKLALPPALACGLCLFIVPLTAEAQLTIMPLGDSITYGGGIGNDNTDSNGYYLQSGYRSELVADLYSAKLSFQMEGLQTGHSTETLTNEGQEYQNGYGSYTLNDIYQNLAGASANSSPNGGSYNNGGYWVSGGGPANNPAVFPNIVLLMGGTNDFGLGGESAATAEGYMDDILTYFSTNRPASKLIVSSVLNFLPDSGYNTTYINAQIAIFNSWLVTTELPKFSTDGYTFVDMNALFAANSTTYYSTDGVHPDFDGYNAMGDAWANAVLADEAPEPSSIALTGFGMILVLAATWNFRRRTA